MDVWCSSGAAEACSCLAVAIPSFIAYRYLRGKVERIVIDMEKIAVTFADSLGAPEKVESAA